MNSHNERFSEVNALLATIYPASYSAEQNTAWISMENYERLFVKITAGNIGTSLAVDIEIATDALGSNLHTLKSATTLTEAGTDDNSSVGIEIRAEELSKPSGAPSKEYTHIRVEVIPTGATLLSVDVFGFAPRRAPVDTSVWDEIVG